MKTLIIHPSDNTTTFLDGIYQSIPDKTVIQGGISKEEVYDLISSHDRVMMMGHGSPGGLFSIGQFTGRDNRGFGYIIDQTTVDLLSEKDDNIFIWCNADQFVNRYDLGGFYTGMFISEVIEANYCKVYGTDQEMVDESNYGFVNIIAQYINEDKHTIYSKVKREYEVLTDENPVALYNWNRLYVN